MSLLRVTPEGTTITTTSTTQSSVASLLPDAPKRRLPKGRVFIHRLPRSSFLTAASERYAFDEDFPSIAASDSTHACVAPPPYSRDDVDRASFRDRLRRMSKRGSGDDSVIEDFRENTREVGCAEFLTSLFGRREKDLDPPLWQEEGERDDLFSVVGYDDFMHGGRRPSAAARMMARIRGA